MDNSVLYLEKQLWDPELGMIMRYLPFYKDFSTHVHAGNGPWLQYTAVLAQYHYWNGNISRGDELLGMIDSYKNEKGEIPEHLSTCRRFEEFMEREWNPGIDFQKEFYKPILLDNVEFDKILEEANNMQKSYEETGSSCIIRDDTSAEGGYIQFAAPLMWSHAEYARALLLRAGDWWKIHKDE
jgi:GH15 family glucan-1,4-alpha-glucosidase